MNPTSVAAASVPSASVWHRLSAVEGKDPIQIRRPEHSSSLEKQALSRDLEPEPNPNCEVAAAVASLSSAAAWPLRGLAAEREARFRIYQRREPELKHQAEVEPKEEANFHTLSTGAHSHGSSGSSTDQGPLYRSVAFPFAADPSWSKRYLRQKISSLLLPPMRQEMGDSKDSGPVLLQKSFENSSTPFQVQIAQIFGKTILQWVNPTDLMQNLKAKLEHILGIPSTLQRLIFQGGAAGQSSSAPPYSYKVAVRSEIPASPEPPKPKPFLVDKLEEVPSVEISYSDLADDTQKFAERAIICRFNGLWPRSKDLYDWINDNWTHRCKVYFCAKGYFIVLFDKPEHYEKALEEGPWFMGSAGLFLTPFFPDFDPDSAVITKAPVWIKLPNLPIHLWRTEVYRQIGNALGCFLMGNYEREQQGLYTYARICVELDLSKGLPEQISLKINDTVWTQILDYENTAFRCRHCHLTGHLQNSCPSLTARTKKGIFAKTKPKRWAPCPPPPAGSSSSPSSEDEESDSEPDQVPQPMAPPTDTKGHTHVTAISQKRAHETSSSESEKEFPKIENSSLQVVLAHSPHDGWTKVNKKKGKKHCVVVSAHVG